MYLVEVYHAGDGWRFSHTVNNYVFETIVDAEIWIEMQLVGCADQYKYEIVSAQVWRAPD